MSPIKQNIIVLQEQSEETYDISLYAGNMYLNRLCIDENAGFELSGVYLLNKGYKKPRYNVATPTYKFRVINNEGKTCYNEGKRKRFLI